MTATLGKFGPTREGSKHLNFFRVIVFPNGQMIRAEVAVEPEDLTRGLMFREALARDEGMLFVHPNTMRAPIHMRNTLIPLDVVWLSENGVIVEFARGCQPCKSDDCPQYGGKVASAYTLELACGTIARNNLRIGDQIKW